MNPRRMKKRGANYTTRIHETLKGYCLKFNKVSSDNPDEGKAIKVKSESRIVEGVIYEISKSDISKLDKYEGYPKHYNKICVKVSLDDGQEIMSFVYIAQPNRIRDGLRPTEKY